MTELRITQPSTDAAHVDPEVRRILDTAIGTSNPTAQLAARRRVGRA
jgi:hypothetical protein